MENVTISPYITEALLPRSVSLLAGCVACLLAVLGVVGNSITILALIKDRRLRAQATTAFVVNLATSDLLFCLINLPLTASRYLQQAWTLGTGLCVIFPFFFYGNVAASLMSMVAITINRYVLVSHHYIYKTIYTRTNILLIILIVWLFSFGMLVPPLLSAWGTMGLDEATFSCTIMKKDGRSPKKFIFIVGFLLPSLAIILCYSAIFLKVRASRLRLQSGQNTPGPVTKSNRRDDIKLTKTMMTIFILFLVCFLPLMVTNVLEDSLHQIPTVHVIASILAWTSATLNPLVYALLNHQYKSAFRCLLGRSGSCRRSHLSIATAVSMDRGSYSRHSFRPVQLQCLHNLGRLVDSSSNSCLRSTEHNTSESDKHRNRIRSASFSVVTDENI